MLRLRDEIHDPDDFFRLGRLWVDGDPDVRLLGAVLIIDASISDEVKHHTVHFVRRPRSPDARQRRNVPLWALAPIDGGGQS